MDGPLFFNRHGNPITSVWISNMFFTLATRAGIQKKISKNQYKAGAHELRDLLKSTLIECGCRPDVADHVIGHMPKDSYEKQTKLFPETLRKEYSKASRKLNLFTRFSNIVSGNEDEVDLQLKLDDEIHSRESIEIKMDKMQNDMKEMQFKYMQAKNQPMSDDELERLAKKMKNIQKD